MEKKPSIHVIRWILSGFLVVAGLSATWAWGAVARLAEPPSLADEPQAVALYAAWQATLFRSLDEGSTWQPLALPAGSAPLVWADDGAQAVAVALDDGSLLLSADRGDNWTVLQHLPVLSLVWGGDGHLYLGTDGHGVLRLEGDGTLADIAVAVGELASAQIVGLSQAGGRLFAATPTVLFYTDNAGETAGGVTWVKSMPVPDSVTAVAATDRQTVYAGTATVGLYRSTDAGETWQPAAESLGLAAGQMVRVTALRADPREPDILYTAIDYLVGSTQVHASAAGVFFTLDGGASWQPLAGPAFPEAKQATALVVVPGKPLSVQTVTPGGLQGYAVDVMRLLAGLESTDPRTRVAAARQLALARPQGVWNELLAALDDPEPAVALAAAEALGRIGDPAAVPGLLIAMEHPDEQVRLGSARALGLMQVEAAVEPLRSMLMRGAGLEVSVAGEALGRIGGPAATDALLTALADPGPSPRWHVSLAALEAMGEPAVGPLLAMLASPDANARRNAAQALGWIGSPSANEALVRTLKRDGADTVRVQAAWALGEIGDPSARAALERAQGRDPSAMVQAQARMALARVPEQAAVVGWPVNWAPALSRLQPLRWLVLGLSLVGAAWLLTGTKSLVAVLVPLRLRRS